MSKERIKISPDLYDIMPSDYQDLVQSATYWNVKGIDRAAFLVRRLP